MARVPVGKKKDDWDTTKPTDPTSWLPKQAEAEDWEFAERGGIIRPADRPAVWLAPDGVWEYRASSFGGCMRAMVAARQGMQAEPTPSSLDKAFAEGHANEPIILDMYAQKYGVRVVNQQKAVSLDIPSKGARVWGHVDGETDGGNLLEAKAFGPDYWKLFQDKGLAGFPGYRWQMACLMVAGGYKWAQFVVGRKDDDGVVREIQAEMLDHPPHSRGAILARVIQVETLAEGPLPAKCDIDMWPCPYWYLHEAKDKSAGRVVVDDPELQRMVEAHAYWGETERNAKKGKDTVKRQIDQRLAELGLDYDGHYEFVRGGKTYRFEGIIRHMPEKVVKEHDQRFVQVKVEGGSSD